MTVLAFISVLHVFTKEWKATYRQAEKSMKKLMLGRELCVEITHVVSPVIDLGP